MMDVLLRIQIKNLASLSRRRSLTLAVLFLVSDRKDIASKLQTSTIGSGGAAKY